MVNKFHADVLGAIKDDTEWLRCTTCGIQITLDLEVFRMMHAVCAVLWCGWRNTAGPEYRHHYRSWTNGQGQDANVTCC